MAEEGFSFLRRIEPPGKGKPGRHQLWASVAQNVHAQKEDQTCQVFTNLPTPT